MKSFLPKSLVLTLLSGGFFLILTAHVAGAQTDALRQSLFNEADIAMKAAEGNDAAFYAPATFAEGVESYKKAEDDFKKGKEIKEIQKKLTAARDFFLKAAEQAEHCILFFASVVKARNEAAQAGAQDNIQETWKKAETKLSDAVKSLESGEDANARARGVEAETLYRQAELDAIKTGCLEEARALVKKAEETDVKKNAPITLERSRELLQKAEKALEANRNDIASARQLADKASAEANHAIYLAQTIKRLIAEEKTLEEILLEAEAR